MDHIQSKIYAARRRLALQDAIALFANALLFGISVTTVLLLVPKLWSLPWSHDIWVRYAIIVPTPVMLIGAAALAWRRTPSLEKSAIELDLRYGLKERLSSAFTLASPDRATPAGVALIQDAQRRAEQLDLRDRFPLKFGLQQFGFLIPLLISLGIQFLPDATAATETAIAEDSTVPITRVANAVKPILEEIQKSREQAEDQGLEEMAEQFKRLEEELKQLATSEKLDMKSALSKLNEMKQEMQRRRDELGTGDKLKKQMESLKGMDQGPAEKLVESIKEGDLENASHELEKMIDQLQRGEMSDSAKEQLAKQADVLEQAIDEIIQKHEEAKRALEEQIALAEQNGDLQKAASLQKQLDKLNDQNAQMDELREIAEQFDDLANALKSGDQDAAAKAMENLQKKMGDLAKAMEQSKELDKILDNFADAKDAMACEQCEGAGCPDCQGGSKEGGKAGKKAGGKIGSKKDGEPNWSKNASGGGRGMGERGDDENETDTIESRVRAEVQAGETVYGGKVDGANRKGLTRDAIKEAVRASTIQQADSLEDVVLPKAQREQTREYFDAMRGGKKE